MDGPASSGLPVVVVGAGVIGAAIAYDLQCRGRQVTLVDRDEPGAGCSFGNMGSIAVTEFLPSSRPSTWAQLPKWIFDAQGPVRLRLAYLPRAAPWLGRFLMAGRPSRLEPLETAGAALCARALSDWKALLAKARLGGVLSSAGCLSLYASEAELRADRARLDTLERRGVAHEHLDRAAIEVLEPAVGPRIARAVLFPDNRTVADPYQLVRSLVGRFVERGGRVRIGEAAAFERTPEGWVDGVRLRDGGGLAAAAVVLAAGVHTAALSSCIGERLPLESERGYHTQIADPGVALSHSLIWPSRAFMISPMAGGLRVGGTVELAGLTAPPDYRRARALVARARLALPGLKVGRASEWMGHRPATPDTLPVMGPSAKARGVFYATGHGHLGLTYAATTARLLGDLVTGRAPPVAMAPYRVDRF